MDKSEAAQKKNAKELRQEVKDLINRIFTLQVKMKNNPKLFEKEVQQNSELFLSEYNRVLENPMAFNRKFIELLIFLARQIKTFPQMLSTLP